MCGSPQSQQRTSVLHSEACLQLHADKTQQEYKPILYHFPTTLKIHMLMNPDSRILAES